MREVCLMGILMIGLGGWTGAQAAVPPVALRQNQAQSESLNCRDLAQELRSFQKAQSSLMQTFVQKNETLAETLDLYKVDFKSKKGRLQTGDFLSLEQSAQAFRSHGVRESKLIERFEMSSSRLMEQVIHCLQSSPSLSQNAAAGMAPVFSP